MTGYYEVAEAERLLAHTPREWRAVLAVALFTGMRQGELLGLQWGDIDWASNRIYVRRTLQRKSAMLDRQPAVEDRLTTPKTEKAVRMVPMLPGAPAAWGAQAGVRAAQPARPGVPV